MKYLIIVFLSGCAFIEKKETEAYIKYGSCSVICDYKMNAMSSSYTINDHECSCSSSASRGFNAQHVLPLDPVNSHIVCKPDCKYVADLIIELQPWRGRK